MRDRSIVAILLAAWLLGPAAAPPPAAEVTPRYLVFGISLGRLEEGARIFTPLRLLPFDHPEAQGHEFPNALRLHQAEYESLVRLGHSVGLGLDATLQRYPAQPEPAWRFEGFHPPPAARLEGAREVRRPASESPLPGLRAAIFIDGAPLCFLLDTRNLSLEERRMSRPTSMGLDIDRAALLRALNRAGTGLGREPTIVVFGE